MRKIICDIAKKREKKWSEILQTKGKEEATKSTKHPHSEQKKPLLRYIDTYFGNRCLQFTKYVRKLENPIAA